MLGGCWYSVRVGGPALNQCSRSERLVSVCLLDLVYQLPYY